MKITKYLKWLFPCALVNILTFSNVSAQEYAFMYIANGTGKTTSLSNSSWHTVGSVSDDVFVSDEGYTSTHWSYAYASNQLTATASGGGTYLVKFSLSFKGSETTWNVGISVNGADPSEILFQRTISNANKDAGNVSGSAHLSIANSQYIELQVKPTNTGNFTPIHAQVTLVQLTDSSTNYYGGMRIYNNSTPQNMGTSYAKVTGFSYIAENNGWDLALSVLTAGSGSDGTYFLTFSASFSGKGVENSPANLTIGIAKNGSDPTLIITSRKTYATDIGNVVGCGILTIGSGNTISIEAKSGLPNKELTVRFGSLSLYKISGSTPSAYGGMEITSDSPQTVTITDANTSYKVYDFGSSILSNWDFNADTDDLNATSGTVSAGNYFCDYTASIQLVAGGPDNVTIMIYVGGTENTELTNIRQLANSSDVGSIGGTGIINIASANTKVDLRVKNSTTNNITFNVASFQLHQISVGTHDGSLPVELTLFTARQDKGSVVLKWVTESEIENLGFIVERRKVENENSNWKEIASYKTHSELQGQGSVTYRTEYQFVDNFVQSGATYQYRLADVSYDGVVEYHEIVEITVKSYDEMVLPGQFLLKAAYPNPFNPFTHISYILGEEAYVSVFILDLRGRVVKQLIENENHSEGSYSLNWDGVNDNGIKLSSGVYFVVMRANVTTTSQKIVLLR